MELFCLLLFYLQFAISLSIEFELILIPLIEFILGIEWRVWLRIMNEDNDSYNGNEDVLCFAIVIMISILILLLIINFIVNY